MSREIAQTPGAEALDVIVARGDELDAMHRQSLLGRYVLLGSQLIAGFLPMSGRTMPTLDVLLTYPAYSAVGGVAAAGVIAVSRKVYGAKIADRAAQQETIRGDLEEPVDIVHVGGGRKAEAHLRWYGLDRSEEPEMVCTRLRKVIDWSEKHGVKTISLGADWMRDESGKDRAKTGFGVLYHNDDAQLTARKKHDRRFKTLDRECDQTVLVSTLEQARSLADELEQRYDGSLVATLLGRADQPKLQELFRQYRTGDVSDVEIINALSSAVQEKLDDLKDTNHSWSIGVNGTVAYQSMVTSYRLQGDVVHASVDSSREDDETPYVPARLLAGLVGAEDLEDLIHRIAQGEYEDDGSLALLSAAYLLAQQDIDRKSDVKFRSVGTEPAPLFMTTLQKMHAVQASPQKEGILRFSHSRFARAMAAAGLALGATVAGGAAGIAVAHGSDYVYQSSRNDFKEFAIQKWLAENPRNTETEIPLQLRHPMTRNTDGTPTELYEEYISQSSARQLANSYEEAYDRVSNADYYLGEKIAQMYVQKLGLRADFLMQYAGRVDKDWLDRISKSQTLDPQLFAQAHDTSHVGDSPGQSNTEVYRITSLTGESSQGFWYSDVFHELRAESSPEGIPELQFGALDIDDYAKSSLPHDPATILARNPDFQVETPYIDGLGDAYGSMSARVGYTQLPILHDAEIVGVTIADATAPNLILKPSVERSKDGMYRIAVGNTDKQNMAALGIERPILRYWVKKTGANTQNHFSGDFQWPSSNSVDVNAVVIATKQALGLPPDATDEEVLKVIRDNYEYSYTPFADQGRPAIPEYNRDDTQSILTAMGTLIAQLNAMNCNVASAEYMLATGAMNGRANQGVGYGEDGDGSIASKEAHAVIITNQGKIIDPTPLGQQIVIPPVEKIPQAKLYSDPSSPKGDDMPILPAMAVAALLLLGYRKRKVVNGKLTELERRIVLQDPAAQRALAAINSVVWGNGGRAAGVTYEDYEAVEGMLRDLAGKPLPSINRLNLPDGTHTRKATEAILRLAGNQ